METITIQGHRGQRTVVVKRKRKFLAEKTEGTVVAPVETKPVVKMIQINEIPNQDSDKDMGGYEDDLLAMYDQMNANDPRRPSRRKRRREFDENYDNTQPYHRDKSWRK